jgi:plasmid stabilization system protein ParE
MAPVYQIRIAPRAADDLRGIFDWIRKDSPQNAERVIKLLLDAIDSLDVLPHRYPVSQSSEGSARQIRTMPVRPHLVRYRIEERNMAVHIVRVRHGARRQP